ncbi:MAG: riboflavin synthase [Chloroflexi bacterium]|nr:riboflavin synthase [Chloroflexota bacterium]
MFTGLVEELGTVTEVGRDGIKLQADLVLEDLGVKDSICVNGACLTVTNLTGGQIQVDIVPETFRRTNLGTLTVGEHVNLERATKLNSRMGGHIVQGHVDGMANITRVDDDDGAILMYFQVDESLSKYIVEKGFVCVDGTSLTVVNCEENSFCITLIPYTRANTVLGSKKAGDIVNIETDIIAKYVEKLTYFYDNKSKK